MRIYRDAPGLAELLCSGRLYQLETIIVYLVSNTGSAVEASAVLLISWGLASTTWSDVRVVTMSLFS
jgi:hypothetical protein